MTPAVKSRLLASASDPRHAEESPSFISCLEHSQEHMKTYAMKMTGGSPDWCKYAHDLE